MIYKIMMIIFHSPSLGLCDVFFPFILMLRVYIHFGGNLYGKCVNLHMKYMFVDCIIILLLLDGEGLALAMCFKPFCCTAQIVRSACWPIVLPKAGLDLWVVG